MTSCGNKLLKLLLMGEAAVGKTALIRQFTSGNFQLVYKPTLGADFQGKAIEIDGESVQIQLWDFPGQERFRDSKSLYRHADGCILVYDATKPPTFDAIEKWRDEVVSELGEPDNFTFLLLGNKSDLPNKAVDPSAARDFASTSENMLFYEVSARTGHNVAKAFDAIVRRALGMGDKASEPVRFELSGRGVGDAAALHGHDFVFVVNGVEYPCCRFQACFVSGLVRRLLESDGVMSRLKLNVRDDEDQFEEVMNLMNGKAISITPDNAAFLEACARELENDELLERILSFQLDGDVSLLNVIDRIRIKRQSHSDCKDEFDFLARYFFKLGIDVLECLSVSELELVLMNPHLKLESEDQLYDIIISLGKNGHDYLSLLRQIELEFLSDSKLSEFLDRVFPDLVDDTIWEQLCKCARNSCGPDESVTQKKAGRYTLQCKSFASARGMFNGIVQYLRNLCLGNPHERGMISISAHDNYHQCHQIVDYGWNDWWNSKDEPDSAVQFDFKSKRVCVSEYSLKSDGYDNGGHLLSWAIEVSDNGLMWDPIDEQNTQDLNGTFREKTYKCRRSNRFVRFVRLRQTGKNSANNDSLHLSQIEFFGKLKD